MNFHFLRSLRVQLVIWNAVTLALIFLALGAVVEYGARATMVSTIDKELLRRTNRFMGNPKDRGGPNGPNGPNGQGGVNGDRGPSGHGGPGGPDEPFNGGGPANPDDLLGLRPNGPGPGGRGGPMPPDRFGADYQPRLFDKAGKSLRLDDPTLPYNAFALSRAQSGETFYLNVAIKDENVRLLSRPFPDRGPQLGVVQIGYPLAEVDVALAGIRRTLFLLLPAALLASALVANALTRRVLHPVKLISKEVESIGPEDFGRRLNAKGEDEFSLLSSTFNGLLSRLEAAFNEEHKLVVKLRESVEQQKRFTADASHELRTPLTIIKGNTSLALSGSPTTEQYRETVVEIDQAASSMSNLVNDLLLIARSDSEMAPRDKSPVILNEVIADAVRRTSSSDVASIFTEVPQELLVIDGIHDDMVRLLTNLIQNALRHTPSDGSVTVSAKQRDHRVLISVKDTGQGIAAEHLPHLGERFYRADASRSRAGGGSGLGLAICLGIVKEHGGEIRFESEQGIGTTAKILLPLRGLENI